YEITFTAENTDENAIKSVCETLCLSFESTVDGEKIAVKLISENPDKVLGAVLPVGFINDIKIKNLNRQKENSGVAVAEDRTTVLTPVEPVNDFGFVAVCAGDGIKSLFGDLGVDTVVSGGQTMNPSTDDILNAIEQTPAKTVFVLPNNKNIIMAAEQAVSLSTRKVIVLPTRTIPMGVSAMLAFDPSVDGEQNAINMKKAYEKVATGQITFAARDSEYDGFKIKKGELLAMENGKVVDTETDLERCTVRLCRLMCKKGTQFLTLYYGEDVTEETANEISAQIAAKIDSSIEITVLPGGQPVYYFYIAAE
ncbi:MAG: DAK2 domain-containing protein, partial [Oscillospiraceae bacterium]|nr:DAK2 domain-containing protein [Candidatus Equicaccousia limihippi]